MYRKEGANKGNLDFTNKELPVMVEFYEPQCPKCAMMEQVVEEIKIKYQGRLDVLRINIEEEPELAQRYGVELVPEFRFFKEGKALWVMRGVINEQMLDSRIKNFFRNN